MITLYLSVLKCPLLLSQIILKIIKESDKYILVCFDVLTNNNNTLCSVYELTSTTCVSFGESKQVSRQSLFDTLWVSCEDATILVGLLKHKHTSQRMGG